MFSRLVSTVANMGVRGWTATTIGIGSVLYVKGEVIEPKLHTSRNRKTGLITLAHSKIIFTHGDYIYYHRWTPKPGMSEAEFLKAVDYENRHPIAKYVVRLFSSKRMIPEYRLVKWCVLTDPSSF